MRNPEPGRFEADARRLGELGRALDGACEPRDDAAARARLMLALDAPRSHRRRWLLAAVSCTLATLAALALFYGRQRSHIEYTVWGAAVGGEQRWLAVAANAPAGWLRFSEGSEIELAPGSQTRVAELDADGARVVLASGTLRARVVHRGHTRWSVAAGPYAVDVTGTAFEAEWHGDRLRVALLEGSVIVRGPLLHEGIRVAAGQQLIAHAKSGNAELSTLQLAAAQPSESGPKPEAQPEPRSTAPAPHLAPSWTDLLVTGNFRGVIALAERRGIETTLRRASLSDLVALSDAARYSGARELARRCLLAQRERFGSSSEAHTAAFLLGRLADDAGSGAEATRWYDVYLRESPHGAFAAEALGRKLVVVVRSADGPAARALAKQYLQRFADGAHAAYAREVLQRP